MMETLKETLIETVMETKGGSWRKGRDCSANGSRRHGTVPGISVFFLF